LAKELPIREAFLFDAKRSIPVILALHSVAMVIVLYDTPLSRRSLNPLSLTRPVGELRLGIFTLREWWHRKTGYEVRCVSEPYLSDPMPGGELFACVDACIYPNQDFIDAIATMKSGEMLEDSEGLIAFATSNPPIFGQIPAWSGHTRTVSTQTRLLHPLHLIESNTRVLREHFELIKPSFSNSIDTTSTVIGDQLVVEQGATVIGCIINTAEGPVHIGKNALLMEGTTIRGPVSIGEGAVVKMGTRIYPGSSIGPYCTVGGEIKNSIMHSYSNKAHDGYLGDSYIGSWCNLGAGTSCSNVKNTASSIKVWNGTNDQWVDAGLKCGTIMGDYSRTAINTSLNSGTTIGVCSSIHSVIQPNKYVPSFSWGPGEKYELAKAIEHIGNWKSWKGQTLTEKERNVISVVHNHQSD
jgi:UDP-N-acetylglucosamine diphosphorylase/glucosamine-1-phosphate N-acetyltransferase